MILVIFIILVCYVQLTLSLKTPWPNDELSYHNLTYGHYPTYFLTISNVVFKDDSFTYFNEDNILVDMNTWKIIPRKNNNIKCDNNYNVAFVHLFYYFYGK